MNRCPKIEYGRLSSEISWMGVNSRTLSSKRAPLAGKGVQRMSLQRETMAGGKTDATVARGAGRQHLKCCVAAEWIARNLPNSGVT